MKSTWRTVWQGPDIVVLRNEQEIDRVPAAQIERVVLIHRGSGNSPGEVVLSVVEAGESCLMLAAATGFAGRVNFERQAFWAQRDCVYWVHESRAPLPRRWGRGRWLRRLTPPAFVRVPRTELSALIERWPLQGPQTWEQRKWRRIERGRPFADERVAQGRSPPPR